MIIPTEDFTDVALASEDTDDHDDHDDDTYGEDEEDEKVLNDGEDIFEKVFDDG